MKKSGGDPFTLTIYENALCTKKRLIKPIYTYKKRKSNAISDFNIADLFMLR